MSYFTKLPQIDQETITAAIDDALAAGLTVSVYDCEEFTLRCSTDKAAIIGALCTTDDDRLYFHRAGETAHIGWAWMVYGNEPGVVMADWVTNPTMDSVMARAEKLMMEYDG